MPTWTSLKTTDKTITKTTINTGSLATKMNKLCQSKKKKKEKKKSQFSVTALDSVNSCCH